MSGPLARRIAELEGEVERLKGTAHGFVDEIAELTVERDQLRADVEVLRDEARAAYNRAVRWATALTRQTEMTGHHHDDTCAAESCAAAVWLKAMGQG